MLVSNRDAGVNVIPTIRMISAASSQGIIVLQQPLESLSFWQNWCRNYSRHGFAWIQHSHAKYQGGVEFLAGSLNLGYPPPTTRGRDGATVRTAAAGQDWDWGNGLGSHKGGAKSAGEVPRAGSEGAGLGKGVRLRGAGCWIPLGLWLQCALTVTARRSSRAGRGGRRGERGPGDSGTAVGLGRAGRGERLGGWSFLEVCLPPRVVASS